MLYSSRKSIPRVYTQNLFLSSDLSGSPPTSVTTTTTETSVLKAIPFKCGAERSGPADRPSPRVQGCRFFNARDEEEFHARMWPQLITFTHLLEGCGVLSRHQSSQLLWCLWHCQVNASEGSTPVQPPPCSTLNQAGCNWCESVSLEA